MPYRAFQVVRTAALVCVGELFFRADSLRIGLSMFRNMVTGLSFASIGMERSFRREWTGRIL